MLEFLNVFGKIFIFCTFLPGLTGYVLIVLLFPEWDIILEKWYLIAGLVYGIGFVANAIGHFFEVIREKRISNTNTGNFWKNIISLLEAQSKNVDKFLANYQYAENICIWYWNSAAIILAILAFRVMKYCFQPGIFDWEKFLLIIASLIAAILLVILTIFLREWANNAVKDFSEFSKRINMPFE